MNRMLDRSAGERGVRACGAIAQLQLALDDTLAALGERRIVSYDDLAAMATRMLYTVAQFNAMQQAANEAES